MTEFTADLEVPARALAIAAHPDDVEFNCGATFAKWSAGGCVVNHLILTDGSKGSWDPAQDIEELVGLRQEEQRAAAVAEQRTQQAVVEPIAEGRRHGGIRVDHRASRLFLAQHALRDERRHAERDHGADRTRCQW